MVLIFYLVAFIIIAGGGLVLNYALRTRNQTLTLSTSAIPLLSGLLLCLALGLGTLLSIQTAIICTAMYLVPVIYCSRRISSHQ